MTKQHVFMEEIVCVRAILSQWSGKVALSFESELGVANKDKLLNGQKLICPVSLLRPFQALDKYLSDKLDKVGVRYLTSSIWAVPVALLDAAKDILNTVQADFEAALLVFEEKYDLACEEFFTDKEYEEQLRSAKLPLAAAKQKFAFATAIFQFAETPHTQGVSTNDLYDTFICSIAEQARTIFSGWEKRKSPAELSSSSVRVLQELFEKIKGFETVSPYAYALAQHLEQQIKALPTGKKLAGVDINNAYAIITLLKDEKNIKEFGENVMATLRAEADEPSLPDSVPDDDLPDEVWAIFNAGSSAPVCPAPSGEAIQNPVTLVKGKEESIPFVFSPIQGGLELGAQDDVPFATPVIDNIEFGSNESEIPFATRTTMEHPADKDKAETIPFVGCASGTAVPARPSF